MLSSYIDATMYIRQVGYDKEVVWSKQELEAMYLSEGKTLEEARTLAEPLYREIQSMVSHDRYVWKKARRYESTGFDVDGMGAE
jgi:hypothetical protein